MKQKLLQHPYFRGFLLATLLLIGGGIFNETWATVDSYTATDSNKPTAKNGTATGTVTGTNSISWSYSVTQSTKSGKSPYVAYSNASGWQLGSGNSPCTAFSISTSGISGTITQIQVVTGSASASSKINVTVGGSSFGTQNQSTGTGSTVATQTFTGSASGEIIISTTASSGAFYFKSVSVTYSAGYSVTYNGNENTSGSVPTDASSPYTSGSTVTVLGNTGDLAKTGYLFVGWNTKDDGSGTNYDEDDTFTISDNITLYAKWNEDERDASGLSYTNASENAVIAAGTTHTQTLTNPNSLSVSYTSSDTDVATVASDGTVTLNKAGTVTITATFAGNATYKPGSASYTLTITDKYVAELVFDEDAIEKLTTDAAFKNDWGTDPEDLDVIFTSSNTSVATINSSTGEVTIVAPGSTTITATINDDDYEATEFTYSLTVSKANTTLTLDEDEVEQDLKDGRTFTLTPTVKAAKSNASEVTLDSPTITWTSSDETVATVSGGVVTGLKAGSATITASYAGGDLYNAATNATCSVTLTDTRTGVSISTFTAAKTTLVIGDEQATTITNDQTGWTASYTYSSSDEDVATVDENGVITAVAKGTATITASLNISLSETGYKAGTTASKTLDITVTKPFHTVTFSVNGNTDRTASVEEGESITFPGSKPDDYNGYTFVGWAASTISGTTEVAPSFVTSATMSTSDITFYAVFAEANVTYDEYVEEKTQTLQYDTWTYSGSTTDKTSYRLFHSGSYIESSAFDLSLLKSVKVYGGTFGGATYNSLTIGDGTNTWKAVTVSGKSETGENTFTSGTALSGTKALRVTCNSGTATETGVRISKVEIYTKKRTVTYAHYCTTVSALPIPVITMEDVEMTWGETGKAVAPSAIVDEEAYDGTFTFEVDDDGLTVSSTGALSCNTPGSYTVTASIAATAEHQSASKTCTVTVNKKDLTLSFANDLVRKKTADASYTQTATASPAAYDGTISYSKESSSTSEGATVNSTTAEVAFSATGSVIVKATAPATDLYNETTATYTIYVQTDPTIVVSNQTIAQGSTYTLDTSGFASGDVTVTSANGSIGSVSEYVITGAAVGSTTITVSTAETDAYVAGEETFTLTVTAPTAATSSSEAKNIVFYESFDKCVGTGGNDGSWSGSIASSDVTTDHTGWTNSNSGGANKCIKLGTSSKLGSAQTPSLSMESAVTYTLSFKAAAWNAASESTNLKLSATSATLNKSSVTLTKGAWTTFTATVTVASNTTDAKIKFEGNGSSNSRFFLDEVNIYSPITSTSVTTTGGIATYCYQYPLDLDGLSGAKAYKVSDIDVENEKVVITQITGEIKGGVPFILKSNDGSDDTFDIPLADASTTEPASNLLVGTLAPTFVAQTSGDYTNFAYSKSQECFVKLGASGNTVPANRAYLPIDLGGSSVKAFVLSFEDADGITETIDIQGSKNETIYNLAGQKLHKLQRGINIVNGKKVIVNK